MGNITGKCWHNWKMRKALLRYQDGELSDAQTRRVEHHLANCAACRQHLHQWAAVARDLTKHTPDRNRLSPQDAQSLFAAVRIQAEAQTRYSQQVARKRSLGALAGVCAGMGIWMLHASTRVNISGIHSAVTVSAASPPTNIEKTAANGKAQRGSFGKSVSSGNGELAGTAHIFASHGTGSSHAFLIAWQRKRL